MIAPEVIHVVTKFRETFPGTHEFHKMNNQSRELQNPVSPGRTE